MYRQLYVENVLKAQFQLMQQLFTQFQALRLNGNYVELCTDA